MPGMPGVDAYVLPDLLIWVGVQTAEAGSRIAAELAKIIQSGRVGLRHRTRKSTGFIIVPMVFEDVLENHRKMVARAGSNAKATGSLEDLNTFIAVFFRGSAPKAKWICDGLVREMKRSSGSEKIDEYFSQFKTGWSSSPMDDTRARRALAEQLERELKSREFPV